MFGVKIKTLLDTLLDQVRYGMEEVTIDTDGYTYKQADLIIEMAKARGLSVSSDGRFVLIRALRRNT